MTHREFSDYRFESSVKAMRVKDTKKFLFHLEKLRGLRLGFTLHDPLYLKFREEFIQLLQMQILNEREFANCLESLFHIGIKDPELSQAIFAYIRMNIEYFSFNTLLRGVVFWQDLDMFGDGLLIDDSLKKNFFQKAKSVHKKFSLEDLVEVAFVLDGWDAPIDPLLARLKEFNFDFVNSKNPFSLNTFPKALSLLVKHQQEKEALKMMDEYSVVTSVAYEQLLQNYELSDAFHMDIGVYDPLHWRSVGLYTQAVLALELESRDTMTYIEEAIQRKFECQLCDFSEAVDILKGAQEAILPVHRVKVFQMLNNIAHKEPDLIQFQLTPQKLLDLLQILVEELKLSEVSGRELYMLLNRLLELLVEDRFDAQLEEDGRWAQLKEVLLQVPDHPDIFLQQSLAYVSRKIELDEAV